MADDAIAYNCDTEDWTWVLRQNGYEEIALRDGTSAKGAADKTLDAKIKGVDVAITLYDCEEGGNCSGVLFSAFFGKQDAVSAAMIRSFNGTHLTRLSLDEADLLTLDTGVWFGSGVTKRFVSGFAEAFGTAIDEAIKLKP